jgi:hypothetical protein
MTEKAAGDQSIQEILERRSREEIGRFLLITTEQHDVCYILESITENHHVCKESRNLKKKKITTEDLWEHPWPLKLSGS